MWPFKSSTGELEKRVTILESQLSAMRAEYLLNVDKLGEAAQKLQARLGSRDAAAAREAEKQEFQTLLGGVDVAGLMKDPAALQSVMQNPAVLQFALKKLMKEI